MGSWYWPQSGTSVSKSPSYPSQRIPSLSPGFSFQPLSWIQPTEIESSGLSSWSRRYDLASFSCLPCTKTAMTLMVSEDDGLLMPATIPSVGIWDLRKLTFNGG